MISDGPSVTEKPQPTTLESPPLPRCNRGSNRDSGWGSDRTWDPRSESESNLCLVNTTEPRYVERVVADEQDRLLAIRRIYPTAEQNPGFRSLSDLHPKINSSPSRPGKRLFDILFALLALGFTLPLYPLVFLAIFLEDGRPFFFRHGRQTRGGRAFGCLKFRTMCRHAEQKRDELEPKNHADGPQFHMIEDPRLLRVGRWLRRFHIDEWPQFWHVLTGDMSVIGPRPSPDRENQYCPPWREARLSVRPGITGLWQVKRTRRPGLDFQEWIRYDLEYVAHQNWKLDLWILLQTIKKTLRR